MTSKVEREEALSALRDSLRPGMTVRTVLRHVTSSGMSRSVSVIVPSDDQYDGGMADITWQVARALDMKQDQRHGGIKVGGCGMDAGFELVYNLGHALWPEGFPCIGERCPSNDHSNGDRDYTPGHAVHSSGGYALNQRWL